MKIISLNCRGLGSSGKCGEINELLKDEKVSILGLQETKLETINMALVRSIWGNSDVEFSFGSSVGASGGTLLMWDPSIFSKESTFNGSHFTGVIGNWSGIREKIAFINIYAPQPENLKEVLWNELIVLINSTQAIWVLFGDFNVVRYPEERAGSRFENRAALAFNNFISNMGLFDFQMGGRKFTRFNRSGSKRSKLDRFLVSHNFFNYWGSAVVTVLGRSISDHCPILLKIDQLNFGPKAFKIFNHWFGNIEFDQLVASSWSAGCFAGSPDIILKNKLKKLKNDIKVWTRGKHSVYYKHREKIISDLLKWDERAEAGQLETNDINKREGWLIDLHKLEQIERDSLKQKGRFKWSVEGDENTRFYHTVVKKKIARHSIKGISQNGEWCVDPSNIKNAGLKHFADRFKEPNNDRPKFKSNRFKKLDSTEASYLESEITMDEIRAAVWNCSGNKSPGPDGFNFKFIKRYWDIFKIDFFNCIKYFEISGSITRGCNPSFIALIPKVKDPIDWSDYRPISLIGCVYKIFSKILASRLARVIKSVICPNQTAFLAGRQILDGVLIANEIVNYAKSEDIKLLIFKVDFEKAFDCLNWSFLHDIMTQMGFGVKWCKWIFSCLKSTSISVLINGSPTNEFSMERGLRQGDPLSPFLFIIAAEALQMSVLEACDKNIFKGVSLNSEGSNVSLLQYADDALFFGKWSLCNVRNLLQILNCFQEASGLKVNLGKSRIFGLGVSDSDLHEVASLMNCSFGKLPFSYLGLPVGKNMCFEDGWKEVEECFLKRLSLWKTNYLSIGGRLTLTKSVLGSLPIYYLSLFRAPLKVINRLESIRRKFFWGGIEKEKMLYWVKWDNILLSNDMGGLNIGSIRCKNHGLLGKWKWRFLNETNALWRKVIIELYGSNGGFDGNVGSGLKQGVWKSILANCKAIDNIGISFSNSFMKKLGDGSNTNFWDDIWCEAGRHLMDLFPRLYALESKKDCKVSERWVFSNGMWGGIWAWRSPPRGRSSSDLQSLTSILGNFSLNAGTNDSWRWVLDHSGSFSVKQLSKIIQEKMFEQISLGKHHNWNSWVPKKVNICVWRASIDRLPTLSNLHSRGVPIVSTSCPLCEDSSSTEDVEHIFLKCPKVASIWLKFRAWWNSIFSIPSRILDISMAQFDNSCNKNIEKVINGSFFTLLWSIWNWRNRVVHADTDTRDKIRNEDIFPAIQRRSLQWISSRCDNKDASWNIWISCPWNVFNHRVI